MYLSGKRDGRRERTDGGSKGGNRREKKERTAATRGTGKTKTALNSVVSLPTFADSRPFALHLGAEEVGHRALFPPIRSPPSYSVFAAAAVPVPLSATVRGKRVQ